MTATATLGAGMWRLWALLGVLWLATLPVRPLFDPDEGRYGEIPREMWATGDWVTPRLNGVKYFEKPPLQYWATAALYSVFGKSEWTARLWAAAIGFLCIPLVYGFTRKIGESHEIAAIGAASLATNPLFVIVGHLNLLDQAFSFFLVAAVFAFVLAQRGASPIGAERRWMLLAWASLALAVLSKGIVALVLTGATLVVYMLMTRDLTPLKRMHFLPGLALFATITVPWFWLVQSRNPEFAAFFFVHEHFARFLTTVHKRAAPWWFFVPLLFFALSPVLASVKDAVVNAWRGPATPGGIPAQRFLLVWCAVTFVFFSVSQSKLVPYALPLLPPLAVLLAQTLRNDARALGRAAWVVGGTLTVLALGLMAYDQRRNGTLHTDVAIWAGVGLIAGLTPLLLRWLSIRVSPVGGWALLAAVCIVGYQAHIMAYSVLPPTRSGQGLALQVAPVIRRDTELFSVAQFRHTLAFYLEQPLQVFDYGGELEFGMRQEGIALTTGTTEFLERWQRADDAIAFIEPRIYDDLVAAGMPGRVLANDLQSVAVSRR
ncbi:MAG: phospholipid carrier-dependent glycosyltransferase [Steroidobacteraceae bacterium]|nr:phospholipid carrier-dependent glycosyltransferase [Steroidobacteraceae bacterium]